MGCLVIMITSTRSTVLLVDFRSIGSSNITTYQRSLKRMTFKILNITQDKENSTLCARWPRLQGKQPRTQERHKNLINENFDSPYIFPSSERIIFRLPHGG